MRLSIIIAAATVLALPLSSLAAQSDDSGVRLIGHHEVSSAFEKGVPLIETGDYKIHASRREGPGMAEIHTRDTDIAYVLQGSATLVTGGTVTGQKSIGPEELRGSAIRGGQTRELVPGDVVVIPNGVPHWFKQVKAPFLYYVIKVRQASREATAGAM
jgi:mannose-6-phosphate isomerase-like protein (cupin superfamily)